MKARREGFTLVEILIVVVILGILAAIVIPQFTNASESAKASNLLSQLQTIRSQLELYKIQHKGAYPDLSTNWNQMTQRTDGDSAGTINTAGDFGPYLQQAPTNPFEDSSSVAGSHTTDGTAAAGVGWVWQGGIIHAVMSSTDAANVDLDSNNDVVPYSAGE